MKKSKCYISVPISGRELKDVQVDIAKAKKEFKGIFFPVSPLEVSDNPNAPYNEHIGRDITALLDCQAVYMCKGWTKSKGCVLEYQAALIYGKRVIFAK